MQFSREEINSFSRFFGKTPIKEVMMKKFVVVFEDDELSIAQQRLVENNIYYLVVISHEKKLVGILSRKYLYKTLAPRKIVSEEMDYDPGLIIEGDSFYEKATLDSYILRNIMNRKPFSLRPQDTLKTALLNMDKRNLSFIPVVNHKNEPCGVLSHHEIIGYAADFLKLSRD